MTDRSSTWTRRGLLKAIAGAAGAAVLGPRLLEAAAASGGEGRPAAEHRVHPGRRPRLVRAGLLRAEEDQDAEHRPAGGRGHAVHAPLLRLAGLRAVAVRADDGQAPRPRVHPQQQGGPARGPAADPRRRGDHRRGAQAARATPRGAFGKWGLGPVGSTGDPTQAGLRPLLRLQLPATRPQLLPVVPVRQRQEGPAGQQPARARARETQGRRRPDRPRRVREVQGRRLRPETNRRPIAGVHRGTTAVGLSSRTTRRSSRTWPSRFPTRSSSPTSASGRKRPSPAAGATCRTSRRGRHTRP